MEVGQVNMNGSKRKLYLPSMLVVKKQYGKPQIGVFFMVKVLHLLFPLKFLHLVNGELKWLQLLQNVTAMLWVRVAVQANVRKKDGGMAAK